MPLEVRFDFHTPELFSYYDEYSWSKWFTGLLKLELDGKETYFSEPVSSIINLNYKNNIAHWDLLREGFNGYLIDEDIIPDLVNIWQDIWDETHLKDNKNVCVPGDILSPGEIYKILYKYIGYHIVFRLN